VRVQNRNERSPERFTEVALIREKHRGLKGGEASNRVRMWGGRVPKNGKKSISLWQRKVGKKGRTTDPLGGDDRGVGWKRGA